MEIATVVIKLSGNPMNTVVKENVTPAQLAVYALMHGEDCVESLEVTSLNQNPNGKEEMDRLRTIFKTKDSSKALNTMFPGMAPQLPSTFMAIGYSPEVFAGPLSPAVPAPSINNNSAAKITEKIKQADVARQTEDLAPGATSAVDMVDLVGAMTEPTAAKPEGEVNQLSDSPLDVQMQILKEEDAAAAGLPQAPAATG